MTGIQKKMVLVVGPSRKTRGGITAVISAQESTPVWSKYNCKWIETHSDKNLFAKIRYFVFSFFEYMYWLPSASIVHIHLSQPVGMIRKSIFAAFAFCYSKKVTLHFHSFSPESTLYSKWKPMYKWLFNRSHSVIALSSFWRTSILSIAPAANVVVIPNPCQGYIPHIVSEIEKKYILFAGALTQRKGYQDLISSFSMLAKDFPNWYLVLAGNGELEKAKKLAMSLSIEQQVILPGWVSNEIKDQYFRNASIFCLPSYAEGFPMAVLDAISYGLPIITTPVGGISDFLVHERSALIVNPGDIDGIKCALLNLISSEEKRFEFSLSSKELANGTFSISRFEKNVERLYQTALSSSQ